MGWLTYMICIASIIDLFFWCTFVCRTLLGFVAIFNDESEHPMDEEDNEMSNSATFHPMEEQHIEMSNLATNSNEPITIEDNDVSDVNSTVWEEVSEF